MSNKTIDELLTEKALESYQDTLSDLMNVKSWTAETRDGNLTKIQEITDEICNISVLHTADLMNRDLNGKPVLYWKLREQFLTGQIDFLKTLLEELHSFEDSEIDTLPVNYDWVISKIRELTLMLNSEAEATEKFIQASISTSTPEVTEI